jgi:hypothetical protein
MPPDTQQSGGAVVTGTPNRNFFLIS